MAVFTYEYRDPSGAIRSERVEASTRAEAIAKAKALGRNVLRMREGAQGSKGGVFQNRAKNKRLCIVLGLGVLLILCLAVMLFLGVGKDRADPVLIQIIHDLHQPVQVELAFPRFVHGP